ncbi:glycosyl hydrolase family 85-domain-containing protein [Crepidotus variabilis]|uniref:Glycosyl hydrolase family 85-domain-containing protein n=1 Tax=Crepidotus variabilis TaxID=179855 RepID=A0A9P6ELR9_9AGAR|nr:glycosyl hydrolase family 85-domain-containing protein [Crepidotus variabilis]
MLGTLIFEGGGEGDALRIIVGKTPSSKTGQVDQVSSPAVIPMSPHYARVLAELARDRGFDGYLLNFECALDGSLEQTRALAAWITVLQSEILDKVGPHGETLWYDSIVMIGALAWQDRLNSFNLPFFLSSTGFFTNYTWRNNYPALTAQYFTSLDPSLIENPDGFETQLSSKTLQDIYFGIDIWGRGSHGGGGFGCFKALDHISPESLGLSVAIFGQAWSWESEQDKPGWNWDKWWEYDTKLWTGQARGEIDVPLPEAPYKQGETPCEHGNFVPIKSFFARQPPPDPLDLAFHTNFCPGTGVSWFVEGNKVYRGTTGWTDVDKQTSIGDALWPRPTLYWEDERKDEIPEAWSRFVMDDAWNGGNSVRILLHCPGSEADTAAYRPLWLPIQSLHITPHKSYTASLIYKLSDAIANGVDTEFALVLKPPTSSDSSSFVCDMTSNEPEDLVHGWTKLSIQFNTSSSNPSANTLTGLEIGLVIAVVTDAPTSHLELSFLLGQLNVSTQLPPKFTEDQPLILWADYTPTTTSASEAVKPFFGMLTWEVATTFPLLKNFQIPPAEDPKSIWNVQPTIRWFPEYLYFNIYAQAFSDNTTVGKVDTATWVGTSSSGWSGQKNMFSVIAENLPFEAKPDRKVRFYVQGVSDRGQVLQWNRCAFVDVSA